MLLPPVEKDSKIHVLVYGSLREGQYNGDFFFRSGGYLHTGIKVNGWKLYSFGAYPGAKHTRDINDIIFCDLVECSPEMFSDIEIMEHAAGYQTKWMSLNIEGKPYRCAMYEYLYPIDDYRLVESGDWNLYNQEAAT